MKNLLKYHFGFSISLQRQALTNLPGLGAMYQHKLQARYHQVSFALLPPIILNPKPHRFRKKRIKTNIKG